MGNRESSLRAPYEALEALGVKNVREMWRHGAIDLRVIEDSLSRPLSEIDKRAFPIDFEHYQLVERELDDAPEWLEAEFGIVLSKPTAPAKPHVTSGSVNGTKPISIRVPNRIIRAFKARAAATGTSYQTLMNRALKSAADGFV